LDGGHFLNVFLLSEKVCTGMVTVLTASTVNIMTGDGVQHQYINCGNCFIILVLSKICDYVPAVAKLVTSQLNASISDQYNQGRDGLSL
jgi:hypothetical protein